jgi:hypothetical protein
MIDPIIIYCGAAEGNTCNCGCVVMYNFCPRSVGMICCLVTSIIAKSTFKKYLFRIF